ncbi:MAG: hypothetical protein CMO01_18250 [Thalassobius sp.]|nr:hypothetical protein [Thalassovita sp.]
MDENRFKFIREYLSIINLLPESARTALRNYPAAKQLELLEAWKTEFTHESLLENPNFDEEE